jgi:hypothetical protein
MFWTYKLSQKSQNIYLKAQLLFWQLFEKLGDFIQIFWLPWSLRDKAYCLQQQTSLFGTWTQGIIALNLTTLSRTTLIIVIFIVMMTLSIMTLRIMALSIMTLSIMTLRIMALSIMTLSIMTFSITMHNS